MSHIGIRIYICIYIYKVSYIHSFFGISNCNVFPHYMLNILRYENKIVKLMSWFLYSTIHQVMWYFWVLIVNPFYLYGVFFSQENYVSFGLLVSCLSPIESAEILLINLLWGFSSPAWIILSILLDELNSIDWLLKSWWWIFLK